MKTEIENAKRVPELDGLRGLALILVLLWHYIVCQVPSQSMGLVGFAMHGLSLTWSGVDLFFVLSGYLIGGILLDAKQLKGYFSIFYLRRTVRIFPVYLVLLISYILLSPIALSAPSFNWLVQGPIPTWSYVTFTQNFAISHYGVFGQNWMGITWSLALEEQFYIVVSLLIFYIPNKFLSSLLVFLMICAPVVRIILFHYNLHGSLSAYVLMPCRSDALLSGVLIAHAMRTPHLRKIIYKSTFMLYVFLFITATAVSILIYNRWSIGSMAMTTWGYSTLACMYAVLLLIAITEEKGPISAIFRTRILGQIGIIAYGAYMYHQLVSGTAHALISRQAPQLRTVTDICITVLALIITLFLAYCSWIWVEKPIIKIARDRTQPVSWAKKFRTDHQSPDLH